MNFLKTIFTFVGLCIAFSWQILAHTVELDEFHVCTVASDPSRARCLLNSCKRNSIPIDVLGINRPYPNNGQKLIFVREYIQNIPDHHVILFVDGYDVIILDNKQTILAKFLKFQVPFIISAEKNCWPYEELAASYPKSPTPFRFINTGSYIGYVGYLKFLLSTLNPSPYEDDQAQITKHFLKNQNFYCLDYNCDLFLPLYLVNPSELELFAEKNSFFCKTTNSWPSVLHGNGPNRDIWNQACVQLHLFED